MTPEDVQRELEVRAFEKGFTIGANLLKQANRHTVDPDTHEHWRCGFEAGRAAAYKARDAYRKKLDAKDPSRPAVVQSRMKSP